MSRNQADASLASLRNFLEAKKNMASSDYVLGNIFASKSLRNTILGSTPMFSGLRNPTIIK